MNLLLAGHQTIQDLRDNLLLHSKDRESLEARSGFLLAPKFFDPPLATRDENDLQSVVHVSRRHGC